MNIFELLPREDYSDEEVADGKPKPQQEDKRNQKDQLVKSEKPKVEQLTDRNSVWVAKPGQKVTVERNEKKQDKRNDEKKTEAEVLKPSVPDQVQENADSKEKGKKKKVVRIVDTPKTEQGAEEPGEDIILLDQYLKEKYSGENAQVQNIEAEPSMPIEIALTDEMKKLGLKPSQKKEQLVRKTVKKANDNKGLVRPSVFTLGHAKIMEEPGTVEEKEREEEQGGFRRDNYKRGSSAQHKSERYGKDREDSVGRRDFKKYGDDKNASDFRRSDNRAGDTTDLRGRSSHRYSEKDSRKGVYESKPDNYRRRKDSQSDYIQKSEKQVRTDSSKPAPVDQRQPREERYTQQKSYRGSSRDGIRSTSRRGQRERSTRNTDYYYAKKDSEKTEAQYTVKQNKQYERKDGFRSKNTDTYRDDKRSDYRGQRQREERPKKETAGYRQRERSYSKDLPSDKDVYLRKEKDTQERDRQNSESNTYRSGYNKAEREEKHEDNFKRRENNRDGQNKKPTNKDTGKENKGEQKHWVGQSQTNGQKWKYTNGKVRNGKDFDETEFPRLK